MMAKAQRTRTSQNPRGNGFETSYKLVLSKILTLIIRYSRKHPWFHWHIPCWHVHWFHVRLAPVNNLNNGLSSHHHIYYKIANSPTGIEYWIIFSHTYLSNCFYSLPLFKLWKGPDKSKDWPQPLIQFSVWHNTEKNQLKVLSSKILRVWIMEAMESSSRYMRWNPVQGISQLPPRYHLHQMNPTSTMKLCH